MCTKEKSKVNVPRLIVESTGLHPDTVRRIIRVIESESFHTVAKAYKEATKQVRESRIESIELITTNS